MRRFASFFAIALLLYSGIVGAQASTDTDRAFAEWVRRGDRARWARKSSEAILAYRKALEIRREIPIMARLGLVAFDAGAYVEAVDWLHRAFVDINKVPKWERRALEDAYERARDQVCRVKVNVSQPGAKVTIDGEPARAEQRANQFYVFVSAGRHEFRATLEGFEDAIVEMDAPKGESVDVDLELVAIPAPPEPEPTPALKCEPCEQKEEWASVEEPRKPSAKEIEDAENKRVFGQWMPGIGATVVYGAVSSHLAAGFVLSSRWKVDSIFSAGFDFRTAMSQRGIGGSALRGTSFALLPSFCVTRSRFNGCLLAHAGILWHSSNEPELSIVRPSWGGGASFGFRFARYKPFDFSVTFNGEILLDEYPLRRGLFSRVLWTGKPFMTGVSLTAVLNR